MNFFTHKLHRYLLTGLVCSITSQPVTASSGELQSWDFKVYLDDNAIGYHHFTLSESETQKTLTTEAKFDVTFLKIPLFKYRHNNTEIWDNDCLKQIDSTTNQNGKLFTVAGIATKSGFEISTNTEKNALPDCISTFAYWEQSFLKNKRLLNSQTGEYLDVDTQYMGEKTITLTDQEIPANHYRLTGKDIDIELWYSQKGQWLGLASTTESGRKLRYVIE